LTPETLQSQGWVVLEALSGSRAYGLDIATSDTDIRGVFVLPPQEYYRLHPPGQINNASHDIAFYELRRWVELLLKNNPSMLELLATPPDCIRYRDPILDYFPATLFLSQLCRDTFAGYARDQIQRARGLNKKINRPFAQKRKSVLDFCYVTVGGGTQALADWLAHQGWEQADCGLVKLEHMPHVYALYYQPGHLRGILSHPESNEVLLSEIPLGLAPVVYLHFHKDLYARYCREHKEYWEWVHKRNPDRYASTVAHGRNYDAKHMMHTLRLLDMAEEIAETGQIQVRRPNRDFLLQVRAGEFSYTELLERAEAQLEGLGPRFAQSGLPLQPDAEQVESALVAARQAFYQRAI
jgi:hypothetical protein